MKEEQGLPKGMDVIREQFERGEIFLPECNYFVIVGGGPVTQEWANEIDADGYSESAVDAAALVKELMGFKQKWVFAIMYLQSEINSTNVASQAHSALRRWFFYPTSSVQPFPRFARSLKRVCTHPFLSTGGPLSSIGG